MYEEIISKLGPIFEKNISSSLAEIDFEREVCWHIVFCSCTAAFDEKFHAAYWQLHISTLSDEPYRLRWTVCFRS
jgi:hypothetical protein